MELSEDAIGALQSLAGIVLAHEDLTAAQCEICAVAASAVRSADGTTMTSFTPSGPGVAAASNGWAEVLDELQYEEHEGPCLDAGRIGTLFRIPDARREQRWPSYMPRAVEQGALSILSLPMTVETKTIGALNVYSRQAGAFGAEEVSVAEIIAGHASLASQAAATLHGHRTLAEQLRDAMASRATIEQAKGILMATVGCGPDEAFERLVEQSQYENRKLRLVAEELVSRQRR